MTMERIEEAIENRFQNKSNLNTDQIFSTKGSAGNNQVGLAKILAGWDFVIHILGWENKPLGHLSAFFSQYQGSVDSKYHNDFKDILIAQEKERRLAERKGISIIEDAKNA